MKQTTFFLSLFALFSMALAAPPLKVGAPVNAEDLGLYSKYGGTEIKLDESEPPTLPTRAVLLDTQLLSTCTSNKAGFEASPACLVNSSLVLTCVARYIAGALGGGNFTINGAFTQRGW